MVASTMTKGSGPGGKHDNMRTYTPEEAQMVMDLVEAHSPRWTYIAKMVSDKTGCERTAASVRNYYKRFCASRAIAERDSDIKKLNKCQMCGQIKRGHICRIAALNYVTPQSEAASEMPQAAPAQGLLALSGGEELMPPLAPASLEMLDTPGTSPLSTLSTVGPPSCSGLSELASPAFLSALPATVPFGFSRRPLPHFAPHFATSQVYVLPEEEQEATDVESEAHADADAACDLRSLPLAVCEVQVALPTAAA